MQFETYQDRPIYFRETVQVNHWQVKVYTISHQAQFGAEQVLKKVLEQLPNWLQKADHSELATYKISFLLVHEGRDGTWILLHWWTGGEMLETVVYFADDALPISIQPSPHDGSLVCVWELEVILHERKAWIQHVLKQAEQPDFQGYLKDYYRQAEINHA